MKPAKHLLEPDGVTHSPACFPCKLATVTMAPSAMVTRSPEAARAKTTDPQLAKDRDAYKRLRRDGEQPKHVGGSAHFEAHANESFEITMGTIIDDTKDRRQMAQALAGAPAPSASPIVREEA
jgi:hypothetical protein